MKTKHHHLSSLLLCLLGLIPGMAFAEADGAPNRSPELSKVDETHTKQFNDLLAAIHVYDPSKEQVEALLRKIGITWGHGCELSLLSLPEKHRKGHGVELRAIAKMLGLTPEEQAAAKKPRGNEPQRPVTGATGSDIAKLHARIDKNPLPKGYQGNRHQPYVDRVMAGLKPEQRVRVGQLWKEKRRLDSDISNPGASFVRILTHVAEEAGKSKQPTNAPFTNKPVTPPSITTQPKKPPASTNDHGTFCACKDCRKKKKRSPFSPYVENRP